jgi:L-fucose isomerase-like protein
MHAPVLYTLTSDLHGEMARDARREPFIRDIEAVLGEPFDCRGSDFSGYGQGEGPELVYIRTGGTEGLFLRKVAPLLCGRKSVTLLSSGQSNSLAASMEILSWLRQRGIPGEILHGSPAQIASTLRGATTAGPGSEGAFLQPVRFGPVLAGQRFGVIGKPSDWLISSDMDYAAARDVLGAELIDIPIGELVEEARKGGQTLPEGFSLNALNAPRYGRKLDEEDFHGALDIYGALRRLVARYRLDSLTLRCFDLLGTLHNTGCLALAILNTEGVTATCEGDIPAMLSMAVARALTGSASFQVNLSRIEGDRLLFAHCTIPLSLVRNYCYDTHFESGFGVAVHGEMPEGEVTLFKLSPDLKCMVRLPARLVENPYGNNLCRTQVVVEAPGAADYFLRNPIGNHHIIVPGKL